MGERPITMTQQTTNHQWKQQTGETRKVEEVLRQAFQQADAYRYNSASIRVRVVDPRFEGKSPEDRDAMVEKFLETLPENTQADIINLLTLTPKEINNTGAFREFLANAEFEDPSPSML
jgi:stress-induced morphogen